MIFVWLVNLFIKSSPSVGWFKITITWEMTHIWCYAYIRPNSLLIFLSEAIWLVGEGSSLSLKSVTILHVFVPQQPFKAETSTLGIYFIAFVHVFVPFSDFNAHFGLVKVRLCWTFRFATCFPLVLLNRYKLTLFFS